MYIYTDIIFPESYAPKTHVLENIQQLQCMDPSENQVDSLWGFDAMEKNTPFNRLYSKTL